MNTIWEKKYTLRAGDFDRFDRISPQSVLDLFQDAAGQHANELCVGFDDMIARSYLWVLTRVKFKIAAAPKRYQTVTVKTWPLEPNRLNYRREYCIEDENGQNLILGSSEWVVMHSEKRRLLSVPELYPFSDGFHNELMFDQKLSKIPDFETNGDGYIVNAGFSELDVNGHVNNTKYANYVLDAVSPNEEDEIYELQIDYRKEVKQGTQLNIFTKKETGSILSKGQNINGETMFACKILLR